MSNNNLLNIDYLPSDSPWIETNLAHLLLTILQPRLQPMSFLFKTN